MIQVGERVRVAMLTRVEKDGQVQDWTGTVTDARPNDEIVWVKSDQSDSTMWFNTSTLERIDA